MNPADAMPPQALIGFGQVRHTRLRPVRNAFAYAGYFLLLPMRTLQRMPAEHLARNRWAPISFYDADHGDGRSAAQGGALAWLDELLQQHGIHDATGEVWLHCYPRVLGYTFKPVSFWFCHQRSELGQEPLRAIVVEVNNTFGQRHCYLLDTPQWGAPQSADKVFHVSPFCEVQGRYRFCFMRTPSRSVARIDYGDEGGALLQTSVSGALEPLTRSSMRHAFWHYPAMTFGVVARIHWQALRLWLKQVRLHGKPPLPKDFVTR